MWWGSISIRRIAQWCSVVTKGASVRHWSARNRGCLCVRGISGPETHDYYRHGTVALFAALDYLSDGKVCAHAAARHTRRQWLDFLRKINQAVPSELEIHVICDNYATRKHPKVTSWLKRHRRFHLPFTPTSSSWLNLVERFFGELTRKVVRPGNFRSVGELVADILRFLEQRNQNPTPYRWTANPENVLAKIDRAWEAFLEEVYNPIYGTSL
jgi:transposase